VTGSSFQKVRATLSGNCTLRAAFLVPIIIACLIVACSDDGEPSGDEVDRSYVVTWCDAMVAFRDDILAPQRQSIPYETRNIEANEHFLDAMSDATPPEDTKDWHKEWLRLGQANLEKLRAKDPTAAPDPLDLVPEGGPPERLLVLLSELPECAELSTPVRQPTPSGAVGGNSHSNATATEVAPGQVQVSFDYSYNADPLGSSITGITVSPLGQDSSPMDGVMPAVIPASRGDHGGDVTFEFSPDQLAVLTGFSICFTGASAPDLGCLSLDYDP
jgi:hypothetical protein